MYIGGKSMIFAEFTIAPESKGASDDAIGFAAKDIESLMKDTENGTHFSRVNLDGLRILTEEKMREICDKRGAKLLGAAIRCIQKRKTGCFYLYG